MFLKIDKVGLTLEPGCRWYWNTCRRYSGKKLTIYGPQATTTPPSCTIFNRGLFSERLPILPSVWPEDLFLLPLSASPIHPAVIDWLQKGHLYADDAVSVGWWLQSADVVVGWGDASAYSSRRMLTIDETV